MADALNSNFGLSQIGQIAVPVSDIARSLAFYRDTLGMRFLFQAPPGLGFCDCGGVRLMLEAPARVQAHNYCSVIYCQIRHSIVSPWQRNNGWRHPEVNGQADSKYELRELGSDSVNRRVGQKTNPAKTKRKPS